MARKTCRKCKRSKPLDQFYSHPNTKDGRAGICSDCQRAYVQSRYNRKRPVWPAGHKICPRCKIVKPLDEFGENAARKDKRQVYCLACLPDYQRYLRKRPESGFIRNEQLKANRRTPKRAYRDRARLLTSLAIQFGVLTRQPCEVQPCAEPARAHHTQYERPLEGLRWLCTKHHLSHGHGGHWHNPPQ